MGADGACACRCLSGAGGESPATFGVNKKSAQQERAEGKLLEGAESGGARTGESKGRREGERRRASAWRVDKRQAQSAAYFQFSTNSQFSTSSQPVLNQFSTQFSTSFPYEKLLLLLFFVFQNEHLKQFLKLKTLIRIERVTRILFSYKETRLRTG